MFFTQFAVQYVSIAFSAAFEVLDRIFDATGALPYYLGAFAVYLFVQMVLIPLRGGRMFSFGSDIAGVVRKANASHAKDGN